MTQVFDFFKKEVCSSERKMQSHTTVRDLVVAKLLLSKIHFQIDSFYEKKNVYCALLILYGSMSPIEFT